MCGLKHAVFGSSIIVEAAFADPVFGTFDIRE
jgi:hypothetical protein